MILPHDGRLSPEKSAAEAHKFASSAENQHYQVLSSIQTAKRDQAV